MLLSTSSNIHQPLGAEPLHFSLEDSIRAVREAGFTHIDITLHAYCFKGSPLDGDGWERWVDDVGECAARVGLGINQTHTHFYKHIDTPETLAFREKMVERCIAASGRLKARWTVMHILRTIDLGLTAQDKEEAMRRNARYFAPYGDMARKYGVGIAIENGLTGYYHSADELLELLSLLRDDAFGLCWDTGHANVTGQDQPAAIRKMGDSLKCLHINDNHAAKDEHLLPCFGTVNFGPIMEALKKLENPPMFTYESPYFTKNLPACARRDALKMAVQIARSLWEGEE